MRGALGHHRRTRAPAGNIEQEPRRALNRRLLKRVVDTAFKPLRRIGLHAVATGRTHDRERRKERAFEKNVSARLLHGRTLAAHDARHGDGSPRVRNQQRLIVEADLAAVEQGEPLVLFRHTDDDALVQHVQIEGVQRLAEFEHDVVRDVYHRIDGPEPRATQALRHPQRCRLSRVDAQHHATQIAGTTVPGDYLNREPVVDLGGNRRTVGRPNRQVVEYADFPGDPLE